MPGLTRKEMYDALEDMKYSPEEQAKRVMERFKIANNIQGGSRRKRKSTRKRSKRRASIKKRTKNLKKSRKRTKRKTAVKRH